MGDADGAEQTTPSGRFLASERSDEPVSASASKVSPDDDGWRASTLKARLLVLGVGLLVAGVLIGRMTAPDSDASVATGAEDESPSYAFPVGDQNRESFWGLVGYERLATDTFDRRDTRDDLGQTGTGENWEIASGWWGVEDDVARLVVSDPERPSMALVPAADGDLLVEVTMAVAEKDAGLIFRYMDPSNYWAVTTNPSLGSWTVTRVVDNESEEVAELRASVANGTTITMALTGTHLRFLVDSVEQLTLDDATFAGRRQAGLIAPANSSLEARWDRFLMMTPPDPSDDTSSADAETDKALGR